uniref:Uncharacterized protein n=1 Tax=Chenopodium quinoa TaxID=63459 RepID=A0A803NCY4_CHEQI
MQSIVAIVFSRPWGPMPEGRKCVACIGYSTDESMRENLGKHSKILKRLLNDLEIRQILKAEKLCDVNQLPTEYNCVNGKPLCHEELLLLQIAVVTDLSVARKHQTMKFWYDKVSGLWVKEGPFRLSVHISQVTMVDTK